MFKQTRKQKAELAKAAAAFSGAGTTLEGLALLAPPAEVQGPALEVIADAQVEVLLPPAPDTSAQEAPPAAEEPRREEITPEAPTPAPEPPAPAPQPQPVAAKPRIRDRFVPAAERVKPIRRGTKQAHVLQLMDTGTSVVEISNLVGVSLREVKHHILNLSQIGVGNEVIGGKVRAVYPEGYDFEKCFAAPKATPAAPLQTKEPEPLHESMIAAGY